MGKKLTSKQKRINYLKSQVRKIDKSLVSGEITHAKMLDLKDRRIIAMRELCLLTGQNLNETNLNLCVGSVFDSYQPGYGYRGNKL